MSNQAPARDGLYGALLLAGCLVVAILIGWAVSECECSTF